MIVLSQLVDDLVGLSAQIGRVVTQVAEARVAGPGAGNIDGCVRLRIFCVNFDEVSREVRLRRGESPGCLSICRGLGGVVINLLSQVSE